MSTRVIHLTVTGRVQGVGFRAWLRHQAELHGLDGWVRNRRDGSVEAALSGPDHLVDAMLRVCRQGPAAARVERVEISDGASAPVAPGRFEVLATV